MKMERDVNRKGPAGELSRIHMRSKHNLGTQPIVNLLTEVTYMSWTGDFQPPFSLFIPSSGTKTHVKQKELF